MSGGTGEGLVNCLKKKTWTVSVFGQKKRTVSVFVGRTKLQVNIYGRNIIRFHYTRAKSKRSLLENSLKQAKGEEEEEEVRKFTRERERKRSKAFDFLLRISDSVTTMYIIQAKDNVSLLVSGYLVHWKSS